MALKKMKELTKERINQHMLEKNHLTLEIVNLKIEMIETNEKMMTVNTMTKITDIKMRITILDNSTTNEEDILETEAHQLQ